MAAFKPGPEVMNLALPKPGEKRLRPSAGDEPTPQPEKRQKIEEPEVPQGSQTPKVEAHQLDEVILPVRSQTLKLSTASSG